MKSSLLHRLLALTGIFLLLILCSVNTLFAQVVVDTTGVSQGPFPDGVNLTNMVEVYNVIHGALTILWGYVAKPLGLKGDKVPFVFVVLAGSAVIAIVMIVFGFGSLWPYLFSFLSAIGIYDLVFKPGKKLLAEEAK